MGWRRFSSYFLRIGIGVIIFLGVPMIRGEEPRVKWVKLHRVENGEKRNTGGNEALEYEHRYWDYGAVTEKEIRERRGDVLVFIWKNEGTPLDGEARFSYRQERTGDQVKVVRFPIERAKGLQRTVVRVVGDDYFQGGALRSWLFEIRDVEGKTLLRKKSFIW
ncbi:MAG: hypothetical protein NZM04_00615 [Methylacidiphilales bacterium]|nr:hypothetical protein [Candidatus Methylacidiphilales bacterium]MDW8350034.1 hypothetical protein [Verrucomicrobiae bacterium]